MAASAVVILEPPFKPTTGWQAIARAHRMGQSRRVTVHRILARNCIDESLRSLVDVKAKLFDDYERDSLLKEATSASTANEDTSLMKRLMALEKDRLVDNVQDAVRSKDLGFASQFSIQETEVRLLKIEPWVSDDTNLRCETLFT